MNIPTNRFDPCHSVEVQFWDEFPRIPHVWSCFCTFRPRHLSSHASSLNVPLLPAPSIQILWSHVLILFIIEEILRAPLSHLPPPRSLSLLSGTAQHQLLSLSLSISLNESFTRVTTEWGNTSHLVSSHVPPPPPFAPANSSSPLLHPSIPRRPAHQHPPPAGTQKKSLPLLLHH